MEVLSFCPMPELVFSKMELLTSRVSGTAQQVFWVDLSLFAASVLDYQRAAKYVEQARAFKPSSRELYNICVVEGLIALNDGRVDEAIQCLDRSAEACQTDADSSIQCSLLAPNLDLAERLLELGERIVVLRYLTECHNVWQRCRRQIEEWIYLIERGEKPDFQTLEMPENANQPSYRLNVQWMRACSLEMQLSLAKPKTSMSSAQVLAERERRKAEYEPRMSAHIKKKLEYLEKDMAVLPDQPPSNPADPSQPSEPAA
jgi:tetratricopeptide (TPR) repeat protein